MKLLSTDGSFAFFSFGASAHGVVAVGAFATGFLAIGQLARGVIAVGQLAVGVLVVGQAALGILVLGQGVLALGYGAGMFGLAGRGGGDVISVLPRMELPRWQPAWADDAAATDDEDAIVDGRLPGGLIVVTWLDGLLVTGSGRALEGVPAGRIVDGSLARVERELVETRVDYRTPARHDVRLRIVEVFPPPARGPGRLVGGGFVGDDPIPPSTRAIVGRLLGFLVLAVAVLAVLALVLG